MKRVGFVPMLFVLMSAASAATEYAPDAMTVFLWHLDLPASGSTLPDASRNHLDGQGTGVKMGTPSVPGLGSGATNFASSSLLKVGPSPTLMDIAKGFTIEMWVRDPLTGEGWQSALPENAFSVFAQYRGQAIQWVLSIDHRDKALSFRTVAEGRNYIYASVQSQPLDWEKGRWYHIAATCDVLGSDRVRVRIYRSTAGDRTAAPLVEKTMKSTNGDLKLYQVEKDGEIRVGGAGAGSRFLGSGCGVDELRYSCVAREPEDFIEHVNN